MLHVHLPDIPWIELRSPGGKFGSDLRNISVALGGLRNVGAWGGGHPFDLQIRRVPPGMAACPFHLHLAQWEFFLVQSGRGTLRVGDERHAIGPGDCFIHPPGEAHQLVNTGIEPLEVLIVADNPPLDAFHYPDSNKWGLRPPGSFFRLEEADYFSGEEEGAPVGPPVTPARIEPPATRFAERQAQVGQLAWDAWESPKRTFRGSAKEISIALGAKRNTPVGLGGHPFEVELGRLGPHERGCPYHSHAAQWELFLITKGTAAIRVNDQPLTLRVGDAIVHPPTEAHEIRNASGNEDLEYLLVADNPGADYWYYPDSKKWGLRSPRMFFRPAEIEYYDGEE